MSERRCFSCGNTFYSEFFVPRCNICQQAETFAEQNQEMQRLNLLVAAEHANQIAAAEYARVEAIREQSNIIAESSITLKTAYDEGYNYIDSYFRSNNYLNLEMYVDDSAGLFYNWKNPYHTDRLNREFTNGLKKRIDEFPCEHVLKTLLDGAYQAGKQNAEGTLPSRFNLNSGFVINGYKVKTKQFNSKFRSEFNVRTGEISLHWTKPFDDGNMNDSYKIGVTKVYDLLNTTERTKERLQDYRKSLVFLFADKATNILTILFPIILWFVLLTSVTGYSLLFGSAAILALAIYSRKQYKKWQSENHYYLQDYEILR